MEPSVPAFDVLVKRIPITLEVNVYSLLLSLPLGIVCGTLAALKKNKLPDHIISAMVVLFISVPSFVFASLMQYFLSFKLNLFPIVYESSAVGWARFSSSSPLAVFSAPWVACKRSTMRSLWSITSVISME